MIESSGPTTSVDGANAPAAQPRFVALPGWMSLAVTGADRLAFLHNFCTNDIKRMTSGASCEAFFCNVKGRVIGHGLVTCRDDEIVIVGPPGQSASLMSHLDRYIIREDVALRDDTSERANVLVFGDDAMNEIKNAANIVLPGGELPEGQWSNADAQIAGVEVRWMEWPLAGRHSALIETSPAELSGIENWLKQLGAAKCDDEAFEAVRIEAGTPLFGVDFNDRNFPQEVGRDKQAISFTKGCYLGQETVARIDALGHVNQQLVGVRFDGERLPVAKTELTHSGKAAGHVTSSAFSPKLQAPLALAMVRREHAAVGGRLDSAAGPCEVILLPVQ